MDWKLPYLAGAIDSDGSIGIKRHTYRMRVTGDAMNPCFSERILLKQVTPQIPNMLKDTFGGYLRRHKGGSEYSKPLWAWQCTDRQAADACRALVPFLQVKRRQAELCLALRDSKSGPLMTFAYWYELENPNWREMEMIDSEEVAKIMRYGSIALVSQALRNRSLLALPWNHVGRRAKRFPKPMVEAYAERRNVSGRRVGYVRPPQLVAHRTALWEECRELNRIGTGKHPVTERTGHYAPA